MLTFENLTHDLVTYFSFKICIFDLIFNFFWKIGWYASCYLLFQRR